MKVYNNLLEQIISAENLFLAWDEFRRGKQAKADVMRFEWRLEENIFELQRELSTDCYKHGPYHAFYIADPKQRLIHKAAVRDRILHHAVFKVLNPVFEPSFIANSFSCRVDKGTHRGVKVLAKSLRQVSQNNTRPCYALKCDIFKFFASVDHTILTDILGQRIKDEYTLDLLREIIDSFESENQLSKGLPIGNLTSQLFANIYMNEFDQFIKHQLRIPHYLRYTDDFIIINDNPGFLKQLLPEVKQFLDDRLAISLHSQKVIIRKYAQGVDFLGYVILPHHILLRTKTRRRLETKLSLRATQYANQVISAESFKQTWQSYLGVLSHANSYKLSQKLRNKVRQS